MIDFYNVRFNNEWIYADAYDIDYNTYGKIKVHRKKEIFETDCKDKNNFQRAAWCLRRKVANGKVKQHGKAVVRWG